MPRAVISCRAAGAQAQARCDGRKRAELPRPWYFLAQAEHND
jgi:hypothetical protein